MSIFAIGFNHKTASLALREKIYFAADKLSLYLQDILNRGLASEAVLLSTCNRSELYCDTEDIVAVKDWFCSQQLSHLEEVEETADELRRALYIHQNEAAVAHIMQVACGIDSMILGEPQILGQMKEAFSESCAASAINSSFHRLFQQTFSVAKEIRTTTAIGACPVSVASAAVHFAKQQCQTFSDANVVLLGAGDTTELLIRHLKSHSNRPISLVNRTKENAEQLLDEIGGVFYYLEGISAALAKADIVFSATGSPTPIVTKNMLQEALQGRPNKPVIFIDIAVPRDIDPHVADLEQVQLYCIDDLKSIIEMNRLGREHAAEKALIVIRKKSAEFIEELKLHARVTHTIRSYRSQIEDICHLELVKAKQQLNAGVEPHQVLEMFANAFTNKMLHAPSVQLRQAGIEGRIELLKFAKQFFAIPDTEAECV